MDVMGWERQARPTILPPRRRAAVPRAEQTARAEPLGQAQSRSVALAAPPAGPGQPLPVAFEALSVPAAVLVEPRGPVVTQSSHFEVRSTRRSSCDAVGVDRG